MSYIDQINDMAKIMNETCNVYDEQGNHVRNKCSECDCWSSDNLCCCSYNIKEAEALYAAGYRKQTKGEWLLVDYYLCPRKCSCCDRIVSYSSKFCPNCGAMMEVFCE